MKILLRIAVLSTVSNISFAALPPEYQNEKDLNVMVAFIKQHEKVLSTLASIDFNNLIVNYADGCQAVFARKHSPKPSGWVGPAEPLEFKKSNCEIDYPE